MGGFIGTQGDDEYYSRSTRGEVILGLGGDDRLVGYRGDDVLLGGDGADTMIDEDGGADHLYGGYGADDLTVLREAYDGTERDPHHQTPAHLLLDGGPGDDVINAIYRPLQNDPHGVFGDAVLVGGTGDDEIYADHVPSTVDGGAGNDVIDVDDASAVIDGGAGSDQIDFVTQVGSARIEGGAGDDLIYVSSGSGPVVVDGGSGNDRIYFPVAGGAGITVTGGAGDDVITGDGERVSVDGGSGNDTIRVTGRTVTVDGGSGGDVVVAFGDAVTVNAGSGADTVTVSAGHGFSTVTLGDGVDRLVLADAQSDGSAARVTVTDFRAGGGGDVLDLSGLLKTATTFDPAGDPVAQNLVRFVQHGADTLVQVFEDAPAFTGDGGAGQWRDEALLRQVTASTLTAHDVDYLF